MLKQYGVPYEVLDRDGFVRVEPALAYTKHKFVGALRLPGDETGDCFMFTNRLAEMAHGARRGVPLRHEHRGDRSMATAARSTACAPSAGTLTADRYVVALGSYSPLLLKPLGLRLPVYPVKGYSITVPIIDAQRAPESTIMDETHKVAVTRLGERIRVGGTAELAGYSLALREPRRATLEHVVDRPVPARRRCVEGQLLVRPAADDTRRHADRRPDADREPAAQRPVTARWAGPWPRAPGA